MKILQEKTSCLCPRLLSGFVAKQPARNISFPWKKSLTIIIFSFAIIFLFTNARRISSRRFIKCKGNHLTWYLDRIVDSAAFFSTDTLRFYSPQLKFFDNKPQFGHWQKECDSLKQRPQMKFGWFQKNEFTIELNWNDSFLVNGPALGHYYTNRLDGMFSVNRKTKIMSLDFYLFDEAKASDDIDDWIKGDSKKYRILEFTKTTLVLVKLKNE